MIGIVFSTEEEAKPFLTKYERGRFDGLVEGEAYHDDHVLVTLLGTGKIKATLRTERLLNSYDLDRLLHVGTCTALNSDLKIGTLIAASQVFEGDRIEMSSPSYPRMPLEQPLVATKKATLVTQDHTISDESEMNYWQRIADVVDMTGYAVAYVAATHGLQCHVVKVVSARVLEEDATLQKTLNKSYKTITDFLVRELAAQQLLPGKN
jgi:nucleoside phosphorylase